ncbi:dipicolinic acid synthetase subunit A [Alteribacillus sp. HJP-4]|uniref:dipicolinic acid synthetase subunit A n=1 Tax=Alteribacillus sp. HJP-4 TaxID=2775394 RepID=UPI0035CD2A8E
MGRQKKAVIIGGDARQIEIAQLLAADNTETYIIGFPLWNRNAAGIKKASGNGDVPWADIDTVLLPVSGLKKENIVEACFAAEDIKLDINWLHQLKKDCLIMSGINTPALNSVLTEIGREAVILMERDDVAIYNSIPTAEGTLLIAMQETDITIHHSVTLILGLGRTGQTIAGTFSNIGAYAKVGTIHPEEKARAAAMGLESFDLRELKAEAAKADICINTIPAPVLTEDILKQFPARAFIIDIASSPGGTDFDFAKKRGIKAVAAPGLPGAVAPKTAGTILAKVIIQLLHETCS